MCGNNCFGNNGLWIIIILVLLCCGGCGGNNNGCYSNDRCDNNCGCC